MRILRAADYRRMPWQNGGGETREVLVSPAGAALNAIDWRISLATIAVDGPFSTFEGIEQTLSVIQGAGIHLTVGDAPPVLLLDSSEPHRFDGEASTSATLVDGVIVDLNVMTRRGRFYHSVKRMICNGSLRIEANASCRHVGARRGCCIVIVFCQRGEVQLASAGATGRLSAEDCAVFDAGAPAGIELSSTAPAEILLIELVRSSR